MLKLALNEKGRRQLLSDLALEKYQYADNVVSSCHQQLDDDTPEIETAKKIFENGVQAWQHEQELSAAFRIFGAILGRF